MANFEISWLSFRTLKEVGDTKVKRIQSIMLASSILAIVAVAYYFWHSYMNVDEVIDPAVVEHLNATKIKMIGDFQLSQGAKPVYQGDKFPQFNLPYVAGPIVDWNKPTVVTIGNAVSSSALLAYEALKSVPIQKIHILSKGEYSKEDLEKFPLEVSILNGIDENEAEVSKTLYEHLGIYTAVSGYLIDADGTILYAKLNHGNFNDLALAATKFVSEGKQGIKPNDEEPLVSGETLTVDYLNLTDTLVESLRQELLKPITLVLFSDKSTCDVCNNWLSKAERFFEKWHKEGYGLILVEASKDQTEFEIQTLQNGVVEVLDKIDPTSKTSILFTKWGVNIYPVIYILNNSAFQGQVAYIETEANGTIYRETTFEVVDELITSLKSQ